MARALRFLIGLVLLTYTAARWSFRYIDPNTGGMLFQLLAVMFAFFSAFILFFSRQARMSIARVSRFLRERIPHR